ncbi:FadR family transcriptional regulator [Kocuria sp. LUK]|uniref:FadR/GntR family transcriptional regulator n=1 Tax=Kocuria sp. LUK TaxID=2897828 RepID=UPI001E392183|nr:FadR/GntR family transcriptional regulator [Kocuria sp. LUK]MCD1144636.1 FadR family transcriptional regulator [Kocuria sp. LUK]
MPRISLVEEVAEALLERILSGQVAPGEALPPEARIAEEAQVSRVTVREALKALQAQHVVTVRRGLGTYVNPPETWTGLDAVLRAASRGVGAGQLPLRLLEIRRMVETGAAELAATRHGPEDLEAMACAVADLEHAHAAGDLDAVTEADLAFHDAVLRASGNPFVPVLLAQLGQLLYATRRETSAFPEVQRHAIHHHRAVLGAIGSGEPEAARRAMDAHITQTCEDYEHYIGRSPRPAGPDHDPTRPDPTRRTTT